MLSGKHLFILSGQSNMARLDPEVSFTPTLTQTFGKDAVIAVKEAEGAQPIRRWYKNWKSATGEMPEGNGDLYDKLMEKVNAAIAGENIATVTFVWMQGERDAREEHGEVYAESFKGLLEQLQNDFGRDDINVVIGRLSDFDLENREWPHWTRVRNIQMKLADELPAAIWVDTDDLNSGEDENGNMLENDLHYSVEGYRTLGERFAKAAMALIEQQGRAATHFSVPVDVTRKDIASTNWRRAADQPLQDNKNIKIEINSTQTYQQWEGFGGAVSELGCKALNALPQNAREQFFEAVFGAKGANFNWIRLPVGSSDFALDAYSFSEVPEDYEQEHFSIERDRKLIIPFLKKAKQVNPELKIHASPWSPPGWMKHSGTMDYAENSEIRDEPSVLKAYAKYLRKFVEAYAAEGIIIDRLMVQNEMDSPAPFPGCKWTPEQFVRFHLDYLKPEFDQHEINTEIWAGTFRTMTGLQAHDCFANKDFREYVQGAGFQYSFPEALLDLQNLYPGTRLMHTETACHGGKNTFAQAIGQFDDFMAYVKGNVSVITYWNTVLDQNCTSSWGWSQNSLCTADTEKGELIFNPDFKIFELIGNKLRPGARRVRSFSFLAHTLCFKQPDGSCLLLIRNLEGARRADVTLDGVSRTVNLPARSVCCITLHQDISNADLKTASVVE
jgi:glucosylceramidase